MENATKALIIAATVLIAILILSVGVYLFKNYSEIAYKNEENQAKQALVQYNMKFEKYIDKQLTMQDVLTIANLAKDYNKRKSVNTISVRWKNQDVLIQSDAWWIDKLNTNADILYRIDSLDKYDDGTIKKIIIN